MFETEFLCSFLSVRFVWVQVVHPYSTTDRVTAWKKSYFISSKRSDTRMIVSLLIEVDYFSMRLLTSLSVDKILLLMYVIWSIYFRLLLQVEMVHSCLEHYFICVHSEANSSCNLIQAMQLGFGLGTRICKNRYII